MAMTPLHENPPSSNRSRISARIRRLAFVRIVLGAGQIMGATVSVILLLQTGVNGLSLSATAITGVLMLASKLLFRRQTKTHLGDLPGHERNKEESNA